MEKSTVLKCIQTLSYIYNKLQVIGFLENT